MVGFFTYSEIEIDSAAESLRLVRTENPEEVGTSYVPTRSRAQRPS